MGLTQRLLSLPLQDTGTSIIIVSSDRGASINHVVTGILYRLEECEFPLTEDWAESLAKDAYERYFTTGYMKSTKSYFSYPKVDIIADLWDPVGGVQARWVYTMYGNGFDLSWLEEMIT